MQPKVSKSCNECKSRKVRCVKVPHSHIPLCQHCKNRGLLCHFGIKKRRAKWQEPRITGNTAATRSTMPSSTYDSVATLTAGGNTIEHGDQQQASLSSANMFIDLLLNERSTPGGGQGISSPPKVHNKLVGSSGIAMFSEWRLASISSKLGHERFSDVLETFSNAINTRMSQNTRPESTRIRLKSPATPVLISHECARRYVTAFFDHLHRVYPFLDRGEFEEKAFNNDLFQTLQDKPPFSALYHTILALGCQYHGGGSFEPGVGSAWQLFQVALGLFPDMIIPKETLLCVQAVTAMAIFAHNSSCVQLGNMLTAEAARMAQSIGLNRAIYGHENIESCRRTFWTIYILEKTLCFRCDRDSIIVDAAIATPAPNPPEAQIGEFNWFYAMCRFSRLISRISVALFSINTALSSAASIQADIAAFRAELEAWKASIAEECRPDSPFQGLAPFGPTPLAVKLQIHYHYYSIVIALARLELNLSSRGVSSCPAIENELKLLNSAWKIIELTKYIDTDTYTPIWVLLSVPVSALFLIFDFIIHNPTHSESIHNLPLLGVAVGYFCRLDYVSGGTLKLSFLTDIFQIAQTYVRNSGLRQEAEGNDAIHPSQSQDLPDRSVHTSEGLSTPFENIASMSQIFGENQSSESYDSFEETLLSASDEFSEAVNLMDLFATNLPQGFGLA